MKLFKNIKLLVVIASLLFGLGSSVYATTIGANYDWYNGWRTGVVSAGAESNLLDSDMSFSTNLPFVFSGGTFANFTSAIIPELLNTNSSLTRHIFDFTEDLK